jgi:hypothetical protein
MRVPKAGEEENFDLTRKHNWPWTEVAIFSEDIPSAEHHIVRRRERAFSRTTGKPTSQTLWPQNSVSRTHPHQSHCQAVVRNVEYRKMPAKLHFIRQRVPLFFREVCGRRFMAASLQYERRTFRRRSYSS